MENLKYFDTPEINSYVFHPRKDEYFNDEKNFHVEVDKNTKIGGSFFQAKKTDPFILYFHGNGETVGDYNDLGSVFVENNINFMPVDYRGYGFSNGEPSIDNMIKDCEKLADFAYKFKIKNGFSGKFAVMGRSLGSASAIHLGHTKNYIDAMIIESGFSDFKRLLKTIGGYNDNLKNYEDPLKNLYKIKNFLKPLLIIHGEKDEIISFSQGKALYEEASSHNKKLIKIKNAGHNTIFVVGLNTYFNSIIELLR